MGNQLKVRLRQIGGNMLELTWVQSFQFSSICTGAGAALMALLGLVQGQFRSDAIWLFITLLQVTIIVALVILLFTIVVKVIAFATGSFLIWITKEAKTRIAKTIMAVIPVENELFIAVKNYELLFRADDVVVNSKFSFDRVNYNGNIRWSKNDSQSETTSIPPKKLKLLHFATMNESSFTLHLNTDETFRLPQETESFFVFPLSASGSMSFLGYKLKRTKLLIYQEVKIYHNKKAEIR